MKARITKVSQTRFHGGKNPNGLRKDSLRASPLPLMRLDFTQVYDIPVPGTSNATQDNTSRYPLFTPLTLNPSIIQETNIEGSQFPRLLSPLLVPSGCVLIRVQWLRESTFASSSRPLPEFGAENALPEMEPLLRKSTMVYKQMRNVSYHQTKIAK